MSAPHAATAAALRVALIPNYLGAASRRHSPSASECDERFVAPDELLRIGADHVSAPVELAVHEEPPDVAGTPQEREETRARHPLRDVAAPVDEIAPHRADGRIARPHEQRPAPVPAPAEVLPGVTTRRGPPEDEEVTRASERVERSELARPNGLRAAHRPYPPSGCEVDLDDLCARLRQGARNATSAPTEGQREKGKEEARRRPGAARRLNSRRSACRPGASGARGGVARPGERRALAASPESAVRGESRR